MSQIAQLDAEIIALITCKHKEYAAQKQLVDPRAKMVPATRKWLSISNELQKLTRSTIPRSAKMCKDKWNSLNTDYRKVSDYGRGTGNHASFKELSNEEKGRHDLPRQFCTDFFEAIEAFQGEHNINTPTHVRDSQGVDDFVLSYSNLRVNAFVPEVELSDNPANFVNLDSQDVIHLEETPASLAPTPLPCAQDMGATSAPRSTLVKRKRSSTFKLVLDAADKISKVLVEAMDRINITQQHLEKARTRSQSRTSKQHSEYLKIRDQKAHKMSKCRIQVLSNLSTTMCHAFIKDPTLMPLAINLSQSMDEAPVPSLHVIESTDDELSN